VKLRGFVMNNVWFGWNFGAVYFLLFCKIYIPNLTYDTLDKKTPQNFHMAIFSIIYIEIISLILAYFFLQDSPRNLILNNKLEEAGEILENYVNRKLTKEELDAIHHNLLNTGENKHSKKYSEYKLLFSKRYLKMSILMMSTFYLYSFCMYGIVISFPMILNEIQKTEISLKKIEDKSQQINSLIFFFSITSLSNLLGGILAEFKNLGKKYSTIFLNIISVIFAIFGLYFKSHFYILFTFSTLFSSCAFNIHINWAGEILPTKIRDLGFGLFVGMTRLGAFSCQYVFIALVQVNIAITIWTYIVALIILIILLYFLPKNEINELDSSLELSETMSDDENDELNKLKE
jgi:hypothetical protein